VLVDGGAAHGRRAREADCRAIGIERGMPGCLHAAGAVDAGRGHQRLLRDPRPLEPRVLQRRELALQQLRLGVGARRDDGVGRLEAAFDVEPAEGRLGVEGGAPGVLPQRAGDFAAMGFLQGQVVGAGHGQQEAGGLRRRAAADLAGFKDRDPQAGGRQSVGRRASRESAADDGDGDFERTAELRIGRAPGFRERFQPWGLAVLNRGHRAPSFTRGRRGSSGGGF